MRQPVVITIRASAGRILRRVRILARHLRDNSRTKTLQKVTRTRCVILRIGCFDDEEELAVRSFGELLYIEDRVIGLRESVQGEHAEYRRESAEQDRHLERHDNE